MRFLPVFFDLSRASVVLIGSGAPATAKLRLLRAAGANVRWFAQGADADNDLVHARHYAGRIEVIAREPDANDLAGALAIVSSAGRELDFRRGRSRRRRGRDFDRRGLASPGAAVA